MARSAEQTINLIREKTLAAIAGIRDYEKTHSVNSSMLGRVHENLEDVVVDFERFVNSLPMEARKS